MKGKQDKMVRFMVSVPKRMKERLDAKRREGVSASGYVRHLLEQDLAKKKGGHEAA